jgi:hypothetical protein
MCFQTICLLSLQWQNLDKNRGNTSVAGTVTVIGIFSLFFSAIRISATMAPFLNDIRIHGCLVFHVVIELPARSASFNVMAAWSKRLLTAQAKEGNFLAEGLSNSLSIFWILFCMMHGSFMKLICIFSWRVVLYDLCKFGHANHYCQKMAGCQQL